ncbi:MAG: hypothetical protein HYY06_13055 [Deltaproteobacteria bacterium]|nr:hypothetical protein [Deltaproteobacteria bacterium]
MSLPSSKLVAVAIASCVLGGCDDDDDDGQEADAAVDAAVEPAEFGEPCEADEGCADGACFEETCTRPCDSYGQCPAGTICSAADDGRVLCVTNEFDAENVGANCTNHPENCEGDTTCRSRGADDPLAFCANDCESDRDCPPQWFCSTGFADEETPYCQQRAFCDPCNVDDDCRYGEDDCIEGSDGLKFCSFVCDPDPASSSCPTDTECREVPDHGYQCVPIAGGCTGDGTGVLCQPCRFDDDCSEGPCLYDRYAQIRFCGRDCSEEACPEEFDCVPIAGEAAPQCYPRKPSCSRPSGGARTCNPCFDRSDCVSGECVVSTSNYCFEDCRRRPCPAWSECQDFEGGRYRLCVPYDGLTCGQYYSCTQDCDPDLDECVAGECG